MDQKNYYVYILSSQGGTLYVGVTNDIHRRVLEHKKGEGSKFTKRYSIDKLVFVEETRYIDEALSREKEIKAWGRSKKLELIRTINLKFQDLAQDWFED